MTKDDASVLFLGGLNRVQAGPPKNEPMAVTISKHLRDTLDEPHLRDYCKAFKAKCANGHDDPVACEVVILVATGKCSEWLSDQAAKKISGEKLSHAN